MYPDAVILNQDFVFWAMNRQHAPEVLELLLEENPNFAEDFVKQPPISSGSAIILSRFHHDNILLIGDAAHAMVCLQDLRHTYSCQTVFCQFLRDKKPSAWNIQEGMCYWVQGGK
jgi:sulfur transfer complex TusBCD TusB component (DsrH family)